MELGYRAGIVTHMVLIVECNEHWIRRGSQIWGSGVGGGATRIVVGKDDGKSIVVVGCILRWAGMRDESGGDWGRWRGGL